MKNVVITGSTKGIGHGLAKEFASRGHNVFISGRSQEAIDTALESLREVAKGQVGGTPTDVTQYDQVQGLWDAALLAFGRVDIWINNAGVAKTTHDIKDLPVADFATMVTTNMLGTMYGARVAVNGFTAQGGGKVFNMLGGGSDGSIRPRMGVYGSTKRGLDYFTAALAKECKGSSIQVGQIRPGMVVTEGMIREAKDDVEYFLKNRRAMNILCDPVETVMPFLVDGILSSTTNGGQIAWLTGAKIGMRFMFAGFRKRPDLFAAHGL